MTKKSKQTLRTVDNYKYVSEKRRERNEFIRNHPLLYICIYLGAFFLGTYLFDLLAKIF